MMPMQFQNILTLTDTKNSGSGAAISSGLNTSTAYLLEAFSKGYKLEPYEAASGNIFLDVRTPNSDQAVTNTDITYTVVYINK